MPYLVLSATAPLLQSQYGRVETSSSPYRLYALSNAGSLLALISYPFLVEPFVALIACPTRHTEADYDETGRRIACPRSIGLNASSRPI